SLVSGAPEPRQIDIRATVEELLPIGAGLLVTVAAVRAWRRWGEGRRPPTVEPGDILIPIEQAFARLPRPRPTRAWGTPPVLTSRLVRAWHRLYTSSDPVDRLLRAELLLTRWPS